MTDRNLKEVAHQGVDGMDKEHAVEMQMVRALQTAIRASDHEVVGELFEQLQSFTAAHFMSEQLLMRLHAYPGYQAHQQEHDDLMDRLGAIRQSLESGELTDADEAVAKLEEWLHTHIQTEDEALANYLKQPATEASD